MASSLVASGPSVVTSPSVSFMGHSERLLGFFSSSKVSSSDQRFRILAFVPVVLLGAPLEPGWGLEQVGGPALVVLGVPGGGPAWGVHASG